MFCLIYLLFVDEMFDVNKDEIDCVRNGIRVPREIIKRTMRITSEYNVWKITETI